MAIDVRPATPADAAALALVNIRSIREVCGKDYPDPAHLDQWCANKTVENFTTWMADPNQRMFAGLVDGVIAGVGVVQIEKGWVYMLYLAPEALGAGLGKALLATMEAEARAHGHTVLGLEATTTARAWYLRQRFVELGEVDVRGYPAYRMEKLLAPA